MKEKKEIKMNNENIFIKGSPRYIDRDDLADFLKNHLNTNMYRQIQAETLINLNPDKVCNTNTEFWKSALEGEVFSEQIIKLEGFHLIEWIPSAPGLFHTVDAHWHRAEAQKNIVKIIDAEIRKSDANEKKIREQIDNLRMKKLKAGPQISYFLAPRIEDYEYDKQISELFEKLRKNPEKRVVVEYNPEGKESMIRGGIGSLRLASKMINGKECYLLGASSTGVSHEGIPVVVETLLYQQAISKIKDNGGFVTNITGRVKIISKELSIIKSYREIPRFCLFVENIEYIKPSKSEELMASVAVSYYPSYSFADKRLSFCSFFPDKKDVELVEAVTWLNEYAVKYSKSSSPIVEGDFDEFKAHFGEVDFPIVDVANGKMSKETFLKYKQFFQLEVNELVMGDKFENVSNSTIVNRSESVAINSTGNESPNVTGSPEIQQMKRAFQDLVSNGQVEEALEKLLEEFKKRDNKYALNEAIMYNSQFAQLKAQQNFNTISHDDASRENARITKAIIDFIQRVL